MEGNLEIRANAGMLALELANWIDREAAFSLSLAEEQNRKGHVSNRWKQFFPASEY